MHVRVTNYLFPNGALVAIGDWNLLQLHVPIDDVSNWRYDIFYSFGPPMDSATLLRERLNSYTVPDYAPKRNLENRYLFSAEEQKTGTYAGVGYDFNIHDTFILEGQGPVQDRTREHLGYTDKAIIAARQMLLEAAANPESASLPMAAIVSGDDSYDNLATIDTITAPDDWRRGWVAKQLARRRESAWAKNIEAVKLAAGPASAR
jgi:hypothetical protein